MRCTPDDEKVWEILRLSDYPHVAGWVALGFRAPMAWVRFLSKSSDEHRNPFSMLVLIAAGGLCFSPASESASFSELQRLHPWKKKKKALLSCQEVVSRFRQQHTQWHSYPS